MNELNVIENTNFPFRYQQSIGFPLPLSVISIMFPYSIYSIRSDIFRARKTFKLFSLSVDAPVSQQTCSIKMYIIATITIYYLIILFRSEFDYNAVVKESHSKILLSFLQ
jgi:hypothetical protein